jgi:hypothetical protein
MLYIAARIATINQECGNAACPDGAAQTAPLGGAFLGAVTAVAGAAVSAAAGHLAHVVSIATVLDLFSGTAFLVTGMLPLAQSVAWLAVGVALGAAYPSFMTPLTALVPIGDSQGSARLGANITSPAAGSPTSTSS